MDFEANRKELQLADKSSESNLRVITQIYWPDSEIRSEFNPKIIVYFDFLCAVSRSSIWQYRVLKDRHYCYAYNFSDLLLKFWAAAIYLNSPHYFDE